MLPSSSALINKELSEIVNESVIQELEQNNNDSANGGEVNEDFQSGSQENAFGQNESELVEVDNELERSRLRKESRCIESPRSSQFANEKEIREHFDICIKLYAENKISKTNVWKLKMIDCMIQSQNLTRNSLSMASTSLDISTKIYGIRVDSVHAEVLQLARNLAHLNNSDDEDDPDWDNEASRRKRCFSQKSTIAINPKSLLADVPKLPSQFFQISANPEASPTENFLTSKIPMNHGRYKYMLFSTEKGWPSHGKKDPNINFEKVYPFKISKLENLQICAPFADFEIDEWDSKRETHLLSAETNKRVIDDEVVYDADGIPIPQIDEFSEELCREHNFSENFADAENLPTSSGAEASVPVRRKVRFRGTDISGNKHTDPNSIQMKNKVISDLWAGPNHWKLKNLQRAKKVFCGQAENQPIKTVKRSRAEPPLVDFYTDIPGFDIKDTYKIKKCRIDSSPRKCNLPRVMSLDDGTFETLMLRNVCISSQDKSHEARSELQPYNSNDSLYFPRQEFDQNNNESANGGEANEDFQSGTLEEHNFAESDLVSKTYNCCALQRKAKKIDMKKLKIAIWKSLISNNPEEMISDEGMYEREVQRKQFSVVFKEVCKRLQMEVSCPLVFVAVLDVATKHNLQLIGQSDLENFTIDQGLQEFRL